MYGSTGQERSTGCWSVNAAAAGTYTRPTDCRQQGLLAAPQSIPIAHMPNSNQQSMRSKPTAACQRVKMYHASQGLKTWLQSACCTICTTNLANHMDSSCENALLRHATCHTAALGNKHAPTNQPI